ncbi:MAG: reactive intermediate/imine deaminase [Flavobacteriaceae bacterium]|nr:MAG: reactive intermediate/imine deaminase [Flavobacteriaceae bacterium]
MKKAIETTLAPAAIGPYSQAVLVGNLLFVSGQIPLDPKTGELKNGIENQTLQVLENLKNILFSADFDFSHVVKTSIFLTDLNDFQTVNELYQKAFSDPFPARETVQVSALPKGASIEISLIAQKDN